MKSILVFLFAVSAFVLPVYLISNFESGCHYKTTVIEVGQCGGGVGYFGGSRECSISYKFKGSSEVKFGNVYGGAMIGQTLFMSCESPSNCFIAQDFKPKIGYSSECK